MISISIRSNIQREIREFLKLAIPLASAQVAQAATGFVDTVMMGWLGQEVLAAGRLAAIIFMALMMTGVGIVSGVSPLVAEAYDTNQNRLDATFSPLAEGLSDQRLMNSCHVNPWIGEASSKPSLV